MGLTRILVLTFKPAVESAWREDLMSHVDFEGWQYVSNKDAKDNNINIDQEFELADKSRPIVVFGSFQDLLGTNDNGGIKTKNEFIHVTNWDIVIFDEYHFGAWRERAKDLFEKENEEDDVNFDVEKYQKDEANNAINETWLPISTKYYLFYQERHSVHLIQGSLLKNRFSTGHIQMNRRQRRNGKVMEILICLCQEWLCLHIKCQRRFRKLQNKESLTNSI